MRARVALSVVVVCGLLGLPGGDSSASEPSVVIEVLSNRADLVSGGDALVAIDAPEGVSVDLEGRDVTDAFTSSGGRLVGLVTGLQDGENTLTARVPGGPGAQITITNHPIGGPIFSGPQVQPWICATSEAGLGAPTDAQCNAPARFDYQYWSTEAGAFAPYDPADPPSDVATTTTDDGKTVPFVIRRETGAMNRGVYAVAVLWDPSTSGDAALDAWNHKLFYPFGASCNTNYTQGAVPSVTNRQALSQGFAVATSSLNVLGQSCNTVTSAESVMMLKEHIIESYGHIRYTFGVGGSGGSIGQLATTNSYPGMLQGLIPSATYPDVWTTGLEVFDCHLLVKYFSTTPHLWASPDEQTAVNGHGGVSSCVAWEGLFAPVQDPGHGCGFLGPSAIPTTSIRTADDYNPVLNRRGCRSTVQDLQVGVWGRRPQDGFAKLVWDNVGIQYGFNAFQAGVISAEQFVHLNENVGSIDIDRNFVSGRTEADPGTPQIAHRTQVNDGRGLANVAILDLPATANIEIHTPYHAWSIDERLRKNNGTDANHVKWMGGPGGLAFDTMDAWLEAVEADTAPGTRAEKVIRNKPEAAANSCFIGGEQIPLDDDRCTAQYPVFADARIAAGESIAADTMKCTLKPLVRSDYAQTLTDDQWARLQQAFSNGVCDWAVPGVGEVPSEPWTTFADGPGGRPLPPTPASQPL